MPDPALPTPADVEIEWLRRLLRWCRPRLKHGSYQAWLDKYIAAGPSPAPDDEPAVTQSNGLPTHADPPELAMREAQRLLNGLGYTEASPNWVADAEVAVARALVTARREGIEAAAEWHQSEMTRHDAAATVHEQQGHQGRFHRDLESIHRYSADHLRALIDKWPT